jgi:hypothetical protein
MKKNYTFLLILISFFTASKSQTVTFRITDLTNSTGAVSNNSIFYRTTTPLATINHDFEVKNISGVTQTISVRRYDDLINTVSVSDKAEANFCTGTTCYGTSQLTTVITLTTNETVVFKADLIEASVIGQSEIRYKFSNPNNGSEAITTTLKYNNPLSVNEVSSVFANVSNVYPNPSASKSYINLTMLKADVATVSIINALGAKVSSKNVELNFGKNIVSIDSDNLNSGIYFVIISSGGQKITKKITLSK